jgi:hypothetical protein
MKALVLLLRTAELRLIIDLKLNLRKGREYDFELESYMQVHAKTWAPRALFCPARVAQPGRYSEVSTHVSTTKTI